MTVDVSGAFKAPMQDQAWKHKVLIGGLINIIPIVNFMAMGYSLRYLKALLSGDQQSLPEWEDWGEFFGIGLKAVIVTLVYMLGVIVLGALGMVIGRFLGGLLALTLLLVVLFFLPVALVRFVQAGYDMGAAFDFRAVYTLAMARRSDYLVIYAVIVGTSLIIAIVGGIPFLGWILAPFAFFFAGLGFNNLLAMVFGSAPGIEPGP